MGGTALRMPRAFCKKHGTGLIHNCVCISVLMYHSTKVTRTNLVTFFTSQDKYRHCTNVNSPSTEVLMITYICALAVAVTEHSDMKWAKTFTRALPPCSAMQLQQQNSHPGSQHMWQIIVCVLLLLLLSQGTQIWNEQYIQWKGNKTKVWPWAHVLMWPTLHQHMHVNCLHQLHKVSFSCSKNVQ